jgi:putative addiction module component (TIGR02574 family)
MAMSKNWAALRDQALDFSEEERAQLAESIWDTVRTSEEREIERAWIPEIRRRVAEIDAGTAELIDADDVFRELNARYGERKVPR